MARIAHSNHVKKMAQPNPIKMLLPMGLMYGMKYIDQEKPENILYIRIYFVLAQVGLFALWQYISMKIKQSEDKRTMDVSEADLQPSNPLGDMLGADKLMPDEKKVKKPMLFKDYDEKQIQEKIKGIFMQSMITGGIHYQWGSVLPLIMSSTMALIDIPENPLVKIYILGKKDTEDETLKRPWKAPSPFAGITDAMDKAKKAGEEGGDEEEKKTIEAEDEDEEVSAEPTHFYTLKASEDLGIRLASQGNDSGHFVGHVEKGGQAEKEGIQVGNQILSVNSTKVGKKSHEELLQLIAEEKTNGKDIEVEVQANKGWVLVRDVALAAHKEEVKEGDELEWSKVFTATSVVHEVYRKKLKKVTKLDKATKATITAACKDSFETYDKESVSELKKEPEGPSILYTILMVYCLASFFLPIKPSDIMNMINGNFTAVKLAWWRRPLVAAGMAALQGGDATAAGAAGAGAGAGVPSSGADAAFEDDEF